MCVDSIQQYFVPPLKGHVVGGIYVCEDEEEKRGRREEGKEGRGEGERKGRREEGEERRGEGGKRGRREEFTGRSQEKLVFLIWISSFPEWSRNVATLRQLASPISPLPNLS